MGKSSEKSKSNYDRWRPGIKLACMMALKRVGSDPSYFDASTGKFSSSTWHTVAENLNKEYPDYSKKLTNINVKDRYDRVMKHHRVFVRMANQLSGFVWVPSNFCFVQDEDLMKQYQNDQRHDEYIQGDMNVARFLCKSGHVDIEFYHRFIHQITDTEELRNDSVINSPSYIEDVISKGILTDLNPRPGFFKNHSSSSVSGSGSLHDILAKSITGAVHNLPGATSLNQLPGPSNNFQRPFQPQGLAQSLPQLPQHQQSPTHIPSMQHGPTNLMSMPVIHSQTPNNELDFSGLMDHQTSILNQQHMPQLPLIPPSTPPDKYNPGKLVSNSSLESMSNQSRKRLKTSIHSAPSQPGLMVESYFNALNQQQQHQQGPDGNVSNGPHSAFHFQTKGLSTGEAVLQIHKELEVMKAVVGEEIVQLRTQKIISFADFQSLQDVQENSISFIRQAYKRIVENDKILDLINVYLNKV